MLYAGMMIFKLQNGLVIALSSIFLNIWSAERGLHLKEESAIIPYEV